MKIYKYKIIWHYICIKKISYIVKNKGEDITMKEYGIRIKRGKEETYITGVYLNINSAKLKHIEMIQIEEKNNRPYFVENEFLDNKYTIFSIEEREVNEWKKYEEKNNNSKI